MRKAPISLQDLRRSLYVKAKVDLATAIYENQAVAPMADETAAYLDHVQHQLAGVEKLEGTSPFTLETCVRA